MVFLEKREAAELVQRVFTTPPGGIEGGSFHLEELLSIVAAHWPDGTPRRSAPLTGESVTHMMA